jgi:hypothetical protein
MLDYMWRVIMTDNTNEVITVALFMLEYDARTWAEEENKDCPDVNYSVVQPKKNLR